MSNQLAILAEMEQLTAKYNQETKRLRGLVAQSASYIAIFERALGNLEEDVRSIMNQYDEETTGNAHLDNLLNSITAMSTAVKAARP